MKANSRSPCADWCRFMKSMSISSQGRSRLYWVWRWTRGLRRLPRPAIHIRAGEKVCIQATTPMQSGAASASRRRPSMASGVVTTCFGTIRTGMDGAASRAAAMPQAFSSTRVRMASP